MYFSVKALLTCWKQTIFLDMFDLTRRKWR